MLVGRHPAVRQLLRRRRRRVPEEDRSERGKPVVVNKWASWCGPCRLEFPFFREQATKRKGEVVFIGVNSNDNRRDAEDFLKEEPVPYKHFYDPKLEIAAELQRGPGLSEHGVLRLEGQARVRAPGRRTRPSSSWRRTSTDTRADRGGSRGKHGGPRWPRRSTCASGCSAASRACRSRPTRTDATPRPPTSSPSTTGVVIGTCRLLFRGQVARLGRLAVERDRRGDGDRRRDPRARPTGSPRARARTSIALHAQTYALAALRARRATSEYGPDLRGGGHRARGHGEARLPELRIDPLTGLRVIVAGSAARGPGAFLDFPPRAPIDPRERPVRRRARGPDAAGGVRAARRTAAGACAWCRTSTRRCPGGRRRPGRGSARRRARRARPVRQPARHGRARGGGERARPGELARRARSGAGGDRDVGLARAHARARAPPPTST